MKDFNTFETASVPVDRHSQYLICVGHFSGRRIEFDNAKKNCNLYNIKKYTFGFVSNVLTIAFAC